MGTTLLFLGWPSVSSPPPPIHQHSQDLCGEALGKRGPLSSIRPAGGLAHASPAGLSFLRAASQPPPTPWLLPSSIISWSLRVLAGIPAKRWWGVPSPTPSPHFLIHTLAPELWERRTAAGHWCQALPNLSPSTLDREDKEQALPPPSRGALGALSPDCESGHQQGMCKPVSNRPLLGRLLTGLLAGSPGPSPQLCSARSSGDEHSRGSADPSVAEGSRALRTGGQPRATTKRCLSNQGSDRSWWIPAQTMWVELKGELKSL